MSSTIHVRTVLVTGAGWLILSLGTGAGAVPPAQAPPEKPTCKEYEHVVNGRCVRSGAVDQAVAEDPPPARNKPHKPIPICKEHEVLIEGKCVQEAGQ